MTDKGSVHIITSYYPPETGAASNRIFSLSRKLNQAGYQVEVTTPLPNYPDGKIQAGFKGKFRSRGSIQGIQVNRLWLFASNSSNKIVRLLSMLSYGVSVFLFLLFHRTPQITIIQCSPLLTGFFAVLISKLRGKTIVTNVSDLWPLAGAEMGLLEKDSFYYHALEWIEGFIYKHSNGIMGQSDEILEHIQHATPDTKPVFLYRNFPEFNPPPLSGRGNPKKIRLVYAGLLGVAQGITQLVKNIQVPDGMILDLYGGGPETEAVKDMISDKPKINYGGSLDRSELHKVLTEYDATLVPLKNRIYGSVPSKIFEYARLGLPIIFFSDGEGADIVDRYNLGVVCRSSNIEDLSVILKKINCGELQLPDKEHVRQTAETHFMLDKQFRSFQEWLFELRG